MKKIRLKSILLFLMVFCLFGAAVLLAVGVTNTVSPTGVTVTLYQTDLLADQTATAVNIFSNSTGTSVDIVNDPNGAFGQGSVAVGVYKRIKFTVRNAVTFQGPDPCYSAPTGTPTITKTFLIDPAQSEDAQVGLNFATSDDGGSGSGWLANGTSLTPFLLQNALEVRNGVTTVIKLFFNTANTLACDTSSQQVLLQPTMNVVHTYNDEPLACSSSFPAQYWFSGFVLYNSLFDEADPVSDPTMQTVLEKTGVVSRWGTMTFTAPDAAGNGTILMTPNTSYADQTTPGVASHRHNLAAECPTCGYQGYFNPDEPDAAPFTVNYTLTGGKLIFYKPGGTLVQGYFSDDCSAFVAVDISGKKENELLYGLKKPQGMPSTFPMDTKFVAIGPHVLLSYDNTKPSPYPAADFLFGTDNTIFSVSEGTNLRINSFEWRTNVSLRPDLTSGTWSSPGPKEAAWAGASDQAFNPFSVRSDGLLTGPDPYFWALGTNGSIISAGTATDAEPGGGNYNYHRLGSGLFVKADPSPGYGDITGNWITAGLHTTVSDSDSTWNNGNENPQSGMTYGTLSIDGVSRTFSGVFTFRDVISGELSQVSLSGAVELRTDCYAYDQATGEGLPVNTSAASCSINGIDGIILPVFYLTGTGQNGETQIKRFVLDASKKLIGTWDAPDANGIPQMCGTSTACDPVSFTGAGIGIKAP